LRAILQFQAIGPTFVHVDFERSAQVTGPIKFKRADAALAQEMLSRQEAVLARIATSTATQGEPSNQQKGGVTP
jgi:hypothetical protein